MAMYNSLSATFCKQAQIATRYQQKIYHYSQLLNHCLGLPFSECERLFEMARELAYTNGCSIEVTIDCLVIGIERGTYLELDNIGLDGSSIKRYYTLFKDYTSIFDNLAWYKSVCLVLRETVSNRSPYTIKTQVIDLGNGYGRVYYVLGNDLLIPSDYAKSAMKIAIARPKRKPVLSFDTVTF